MSQTKTQPVEFSVQKCDDMYLLETGEEPPIVTPLFTVVALVGEEMNWETHYLAFCESEEQAEQIANAVRMADANDKGGA